MKLLPHQAGLAARSTPSPPLSAVLSSEDVTGTKRSQICSCNFASSVVHCTLYLLEYITNKNEHMHAALPGELQTQSSCVLYAMARLESSLASEQAPVVCRRYFITADMFLAICLSGYNPRHQFRQHRAEDCRPRSELKVTAATLYSFWHFLAWPKHAQHV